jgi:hypothetical protein
MHICAGCRQKLLNRRQHRLHYLSGSADQLPIAFLLAPALPPAPLLPPLRVPLWQERLEPQ